MEYFVFHTDTDASKLDLIQLSRQRIRKSLKQKAFIFHFLDEENPINLEQQARVSTPPSVSETFYCVEWANTFPFDDINIRSRQV